MNEIDPGHQLRDAMLDLQPRVDLEEPEVAVRREEELGCRGVAEPDARGDRHSQLVQANALLRRQPGRRRLLDELLVAALDRAIALANCDHLPSLSPSS